MTKIAIIIPYFGKLPNTFPFFLQSCKNNKDIDFLVVTDLFDSKSATENIKIVNVTFNELCDRIQKLFDFKICLPTPYKLCDYKPLYGHIFENELKNYDFWGYCDADLIFGNLRKFITEDLLQKYDRIFDRGHFSLYRNNKKMNLLYKSCSNFPIAFQYPEIFIFDESYYEGINKTCMDLKISFFRERLSIFDVNPSKFSFRNLNDNKKNNVYFQLRNETLLSINIKDKKKNEWIYAHFQKRKFKIDSNCDVNNFYIVPNCYCSNKKLEEHLKNQKLHPFYCFHYYKYRIKNAVKKRFVRLIKKLEKFYEASY